MGYGINFGNQGHFRPSEGIVKLYVPKEKWMKRLLEKENIIRYNYYALASNVSVLISTMTEYPISLCTFW